VDGGATWGGELINITMSERITEIPGAGSEKGGKSIILRWGRKMPKVV